MGSSVAALVVLGLLCTTAAVVAREEPNPRPLFPMVWVDDGTRSCYGNFPCLQSISVAMANVDASGTIVVYGSPQAYNERDILVDKPVSILGENVANTTINAGFGTNVFEVTVGPVTIANFTLVNALQAIWTGANATAIRDVVITGSTIGVVFQNAPMGTLLRTEIQNAAAGSVLVDQSANVSIAGSRFLGGGRGLTVTNSPGFTMNGTVISGGIGPGVTLGATADARIGPGNSISDGLNRGIWTNGSDRLSIVGNTIERNALTGVNISYSVGVTVRDNRISGNGGSGILPRGGPGPRPWQGIGGGLWFWQTDPVLVDNNSVTGNARFGVEIGGPLSKDFVLVNNTIAGNAGPGLVLTQGASRIDVKGDFVGNQGDGIAMDNVTAVTVRDARLIGNTAMAVRGMYAVDVRVEDSRMEANGIPVPPGPDPRSSHSGGMWFWQTDPSEIHNNTIVDNYGAGVTLVDTADFDVTNNSFTGNQGSAVLLTSPLRSTVAGNRFLGGFAALEVDGGDAVASRNLFTNLTRAVFLRGGSALMGWNNTFEGVTNEYFLDGASRGIATNETFASRAFGLADDLSNLTIRWFLEVRVLDADGNPAGSATVRAFDAFRGEEFNGTADGQGRRRWIALAEEDITRPRTFARTPHEAQAYVTGPDLGSTAALMNRSHNVTIRLFRDTIRPAIGNVSAVPNPQEQFQAVNVSATVDDQTAVTVWLNVTFPDSTWLNATMTRGAGSKFYLERTYDQVGVHTFWVAAQDAFGNDATLPGLFRIVPPNPGPNITNVVAAPDPQEGGGSVNVSATVTDPDGVAGVTILFAYPSGSSIFRTMSPGPGNVWYYPDTYTEIGVYQFVITATDGNATFPRSSQASGTFRVQDTTPPVADAGPDQTVPEGTLVTFDGSGSTDNLGIQSYTWTFNDGGPQSLSGVSPSYPFARFGVFLVTLTVTDFLGNTGSDTMTVTVVDVTPPLIQGLAANPSPAETPGTTNVTFAVVEANTVAVAKIAAYDPNDVLLGNVTAAYDGPSGRYFHVWSVAILGTYRFVAYAEDQSANFGASTRSVVAFDTTDPAVAAVGAQPSTQQVLQPVLLWALASDPFLSAVSVTALSPLGTSTTLAMTLNGATARYEVSFVPSELGAYTFRVDAVDSSANVGSLSGSFVSQDTILPTLSALAVVPDPVPMGASADVSVVAADDFRVVRVWFDLTDPLGAPVGSFDLIFDPGDALWHDLRAYPQLGAYPFVVWVEDGAGNRASVAGQVNVVDREPPVVGPLTKSPTTWETGGAIGVSASVTDNVALDRVSLQVIDPLGREAGNHTMVCVSDVCSFSRAYGIAGLYSLHVWAYDTSGNLGTASDTLTIVDGLPPTADAGPDIAIDAGETATFNGSLSTDDFGVVSYVWTFTYRGSLVTRTGPQPSFVFEDPGEYTVTLTVADVGGKSATDTLVVTVRPGGGVGPSLLLPLILIILLASLAIGAWVALRRRGRKGEKPAEAEPRKSDETSETPSQDEVDKEIEDALEELENL